MTDRDEQAIEKAKMTSQQLPLVVDLDGTLLVTDSLWESVTSMISRQPQRCLELPLFLLKGRAAFKSAVAPYALNHVAEWPYNEAVLEVIREAKREGREVCLATAAHKDIAGKVADHLGLFDCVLATEYEGTEDHVVSNNLKGEKKAEALCARYGEKGFDYIGDSSADLAVWSRARKAIIVGRNRIIASQLEEQGIPVSFLSAPVATARTYVKALRVHQWVKNILVFLPLLLAHRFSLEDFGAVLLGFICFCATASSVYLLNDLLDLAADRRHPTKRRRPFAAGLIPLWQGVPLAAGGLCGAALLCLFLPTLFALTLLSYFIVTCAYSFYIKQTLLLDIVVLSGLYLLRIVAGAMALEISLSNWLIGFAFFFFLGLALIKRGVEARGLHGKDDNDSMKRRAYRGTDKVILEMMAVCSAFCSVLVFSLYIDSLQAASLYSRPFLLWLLCPLLVYWYGRILLMTHRGEMYDDPVEFVGKDKISYVCFFVGIIPFLAAL